MLLAAFMFDNPLSEMFEIVQSSFIAKGFVHAHCCFPTFAALDIEIVGLSPDSCLASLKRL